MDKLHGTGFAVNGRPTNPAPKEFRPKPPGTESEKEEKAMDETDRIVVTVKRQGPDHIVCRRELDLTFPEYQTFMRTGELPGRFDEHGEDARISTAIVPG